MKKFIYLIEQPLDKRNFERYGVTVWEGFKCKAEVWDITPIRYPQLWKRFHASSQKLASFDGYIPINSFIQLSKLALSAKTVNYYADLSGVSFYSFVIQLALKFFSAKRVVVHAGLHPTPKNEKNLFKKIASIQNHGIYGSLSILINIGFERILNKWIGADVLVLSGSKSEWKKYKAKLILYAHNYDYDIHIKNSFTEKKKNNLKYLVFIDQDYCFHSDFLLDNQKFPATYENYYPIINKFISRTKQLLNLNASIVAAHPRISDFVVNKRLYEDNKIVHGKTIELIEGSEVVICHDSTSIQNAVLCFKPIIFITTNELESSPWGKYIEATATELGKVVINLNSKIDDQIILNQIKVDVNLYEKYIESYIKKNRNENKMLWQLVAENL
jgi:hypothetical protein